MVGRLFSSRSRRCGERARKKFVAIDVLKMSKEPKVVSTTVLHFTSTLPEVQRDLGSILL